jgi:hypothetical protein
MAGVPIENQGIPNQGAERGCFGWIRRHRALMAAVVAAGFGGCACLARDVLSNASSDVAFEKSRDGSADRWGFLDEDQKEAAVRILSIPCEDLERRFSKGKISRISTFDFLFRMTRRAQESIDRGDPREIKRRVFDLYLTMEVLEKELAKPESQEVLEDAGSRDDLVEFWWYYGKTRAPMLSLLRIKS